MRPDSKRTYRRINSERAGLSRNRRARFNISSLLGGKRERKKNQTQFARQSEIRPGAKKACLKCETLLLFSLLHHSLAVRNLFEMFSGVKKGEKFPTSSLNPPLHLQSRRRRRSIYWAAAAAAAAESAVVESSIVCHTLHIILLFPPPFFPSSPAPSFFPSFIIRILYFSSLGLCVCVCLKRRRHWHPTAV